MGLLVVGGALVGFAFVWVVVWAGFRMMDRSGDDWGLAYNIWEKSPEKQEENKRRRIAQQATIARRLRRGLPVAVTLAAVGIVLAAVGAMVHPL